MTNGEKVAVENGHTTSLRKLARRIETSEARLEALRSDRNIAIFHACAVGGVTERAAASAAGVSYAYVHRCKVREGKP